MDNKESKQWLTTSILNNALCQDVLICVGEVVEVAEVAGMMISKEVETNGDQKITIDVSTINLIGRWK